MKFYRSLIDFKNRFRKWTLLSKLNFIGFWLAIIFFLCSVWGYNYFKSYYISQKQSSLENQLISSFSIENWAKYDNCLRKISSKSYDPNIYFYYAGLRVLKREKVYDILINPEFYFNQININSDYYEKAISARMIYYRKNFNNEEFIQKMEFLSEKLEREGYLSPKYYLINFLISQNQGHGNVVEVYKGFKNHFKIIRKGLIQPSYFPADIGDINLNSFHELVALEYLYNLAILKDKGLSPAGNEAKTKLMTMFRNDNDLEAIRWGFDILGLGMPETEHLRKVLKSVSNY